MKVVGRRKQNLSSFRDSFELSRLVTVGQLLSVTTIHAGAREGRQLDPQNLQSKAIHAGTRESQ